jgi:hypothetical protein
MYKIIGGDNQEYGPVSADQVRQWIAEGRASGTTRCRAEAETDWRTLADIAEFAAALEEKAKRSKAPPLFLPGSAEETQEILSRDVLLPLGRCLDRGWSLMLANYGLFFGTVLVAWVIQFVLGFIPFIGGLAALVVMGPITGGVYLVYLRRRRGEDTSVGDVFSGFQNNFVNLMLVGVLFGLLTFLGYCFCLVPGIYLAVAYVFAAALAADKRMEFWPALELSRKVVTRHWFSVAVLLLIVFLPVIIYFIYASVSMGSLITGLVNSGDLDFAAWAKGNPDLVAKQIQKCLEKIQLPLIKLMMFQQLVFVLTLPFARAVLTEAYEILFGPRHDKSA